MKIIDSHVHIYPEKIAERASQSIADFYNMPVKYDGTVQKLIEICERNQITNCVICSVATIPERVNVINEFIAESANASKRSKDSTVTFTGLCALHPEMTEAEIDAELMRAKSAGLKGIKLHPDFQEFRIDDKNAYKIYERAEGKFPILFHTGDKRYNYSNPNRLAKILRDFPKLTAIGAHFGGWSEWGDADCLTGFENLYVDTSSSLYELKPEAAKKLIRMFGENRVLFGSDYPMWNAEDEIKLIENLKLSERVKELIFHKNAERVYKL
ncbi:MAG: amidohydrolase family protein [Oscillospiraceae bacterium]|nr:amidohydrolase family protein [Oscillospiraceae bacterium]